MRLAGSVRRLVLLALIAIGALCVTTSTVVADPGQVSVERVMTDGFAESFFGACDFNVPPGPLSCHETHVQVFKEADSLFSPSTAPPKTPWAIFIDDYTLTFETGGPDAVPVFSDERTGFLLRPTVTFDQQHLSSLAVEAQVPMSDGSRFGFHGVWTATSGLMQFGNDGPTLNDIGIPRHYVDRCETFNAQAHQKFRRAKMTGTLNGAPVQSYPDLHLDVLAYNHFVFIAAAHGSC